MAANDQPWSDDWTVDVRIWAERRGHTIFGEQRLELLEAIDRWHSISEAARQMGISYRHAWLQVQSMNKAAGKPLVEASTGGLRGGGARLTPLGRSAVNVFRTLEGHLFQAAANLLPSLVAGPETKSVHVAAAVSLEEVLGQLLADYALRQPTIRVRTVFGASDELAEHVLAGAPADVFLTADPMQLDRLQAAELVKPGTRAVLAENSLAAIGPAEGDVPIHKPADLSRSQVTRIAVAGPDSPLGSYTRAYLQELTLYDALLPRTMQLDNSRAVIAALRAGQADVGLVYSSDAVNAAGCRLLFQVRRTSVSIQYEAAILDRGQSQDHAGALLDFLTSRRAAGRFRRCGFLPIRGATK